jgi:hypothetical protein
MEESLDIPEESMRHIEALLAQHTPSMIQRMFSQAIDSRRFDGLVSVQIVADKAQDATPSLRLLCRRLRQVQPHPHPRHPHGGLVYRLLLPSRHQQVAAIWRLLLLRRVRPDPE